MINKRKIVEIVNYICYFKVNQEQNNCIKLMEKC